MNRYGDLGVLRKRLRSKAKLEMVIGWYTDLITALEKRKMRHGTPDFDKALAFLGVLKTSGQKWLGEGTYAFESCSDGIRDLLLILKYLIDAMVDPGMIAVARKDDCYEIDWQRLVEQAVNLADRIGKDPSDIEKILGNHSMR